MGKKLIKITLITLAFSMNSIFAARLPLERIKLPPGFKISVYASGLQTARAMDFSPSGVLFVGSKKGNVYAIVDKNKDGKADKKYIIARGLELPVGVSFYRGDLYISAVSRIYKLTNIEKRLSNPPRPKLITKVFPKDRWHGWKFIAFGPDGWLYVPVGAPCNVCFRSNPVYSSIMRMRPDGSKLELYASGVRNTVGFDWHPKTKELWFTENGRDYMGDNIPPDEMNLAYKKGLHFGFPYLHGKKVWDPVYGRRKRAKSLKFVDPKYELPAHVAALGMRFYMGKNFPKKFRGQIFIAEHGSWNRSRPIGYRVSFMQLKQNKVIKYGIFASGWLYKGKAWGRPADVEVGPDGALYISDDKANVIYRVVYQNK